MERKIHFITYGGDETCLDIEPMYGGKFAYQPILLCNKK